MQIEVGGRTGIDTDGTGLRIKAGGEVRVSKCFTGLEIVTEEGAVFGLCQRDYGFDVTLHGVFAGHLSPVGTLWQGRKEPGGQEAGAEEGGTTDTP